MVGTLLALVLTLLPSALVYTRLLPRGPTLVVVAACALVQVVVHLRFFLHLGWSHKREDLQLVLFSSVLLIIMVAGTLWIMGNLASRMGMPGQTNAVLQGSPPGSPRFFHPTESTS